MLSGEKKANNTQNKTLESQILLINVKNEHQDPADQSFKRLPQTFGRDPAKALKKSCTGKNKGTEINYSQK